MGFLLVFAVLLWALVTFLNGFHDASNAVATSVRTRALTPGLATIMVARVRTLTALTLAVWGLSHSIERCVSARVWVARLSSRKACLCCADAFFPRDRVGRVLANGLALARSQAARVCRRMDPLSLIHI